MLFVFKNVATLLSVLYLCARPPDTNIYFCFELAEELLVLSMQWLYVFKEFEKSSSANILLKVRTFSKSALIWTVIRLLTESGEDVHVCVSALYWISRCWVITGCSTVMMHSWEVQSGWRRTGVDGISAQINTEWSDKLDKWRQPYNTSTSATDVN